jgi:hypothetical protein
MTDNFSNNKGLLLELLTIYMFLIWVTELILKFICMLLYINFFDKRLNKPDYSSLQISYLYLSFCFNLESIILRAI